MGRYADLHTHWFGSIKTMRLSLSISPKYDSPIFEAIAVQIFVAIVGALIIDPIGLAQVLGIALLAFWGGVVVLIWRHPQSPSRFDLVFIRFGYFVVIPVAFFVVPLVWQLRGFL
jgi:hypothetical protein